VQQAVAFSSQNGTPPSRSATASHLGDQLFAGAARAAGVFVLLLLGSLILSLFIGGLPAFRHFGVGFLFSTDWDPVKEVFGAGVSVYGTVLTAVLALALAAIGRPDVAVYDGSWSEWGARAETPVAVGPA